MPDIQTYTRLYPEILECQTRWIKEHADSITFVLQQGDMTEIILMNSGKLQHLE